MKSDAGRQKAEGRRQKTEDGRPRRAPDESGLSSAVDSGLQLHNSG